MSFSDRAVNALLSAPDLRRRDGQLKMLHVIAQSLSGERSERNVVVEAGTGTGKSLAYLIPVMMYCVEKGKRAVVATGTKNLQDQLARKDAPMAADVVARAVGKRPSFAVMYGKGNYLCPMLLRWRLQELLEKQAQVSGTQVKENGEETTRKETEEVVFLKHLSAWMEEGGSGFREDLPFWFDVSGTQDDRNYWWHRVSAADDDADCASCSERGRCAFRIARETAASADVVIANHYLVAADFLLREKAGGLSIFTSRMDRRPPEILVVDEAHAFPEAVKESRGCAFTRGRVSRLRSDILRFLREIDAWVKDRGLRGEKAAKMRGSAEDWSAKNFSTLETRMNAFFTWASEHLAGHDRRSLLPGQVPSGAGDLLHELKVFFSKLVNFANDSVSFAESVVATSADDEGEKGDEKRRELERFRLRFERLRERFYELCEALRRSLLLERHYRLVGCEEGDVCWVQPGRFAARPVDASSYMTGIWVAHENVMLTSATLFPFPQSEAFAWFVEKFGLNREETAMGIVPSPFRYDEQMRAVVLSDPDLLFQNDGGVDGGDGADRRVRKLAEVVSFVAERARGGVLVLFTSLWEMLSVAEVIMGERAVPEDRTLLVQGVHGGKAELLDRFKKHGRAVLFGVDSFWQGVDLPGDLVTTLIIAKIPFPCPDDPDVEAEVWLAGEEWWKKVYRPRTALALRQGVGRLIRTETDSGTLVIADPRAAGKHRKLVQSCLPVALKEMRSL